MSIDKSKIMKAVGKPVTMKYPGSEGTHRGILKSREIARSGKGHTGASYCTVVDIIRFDGKREPWLRIGYYRQPMGATSPRWASQTTWCGPLSQWRNNVLPALKKSMEKADAI
jgi:hypothetical protein